MPISAALTVVDKRGLPEVERMFREHYELVYRTAYSILKNAADAEDVLQTVFVRLVRREATPDPGGNVIALTAACGDSGSVGASAARIVGATTKRTNAAVRNRIAFRIGMNYRRSVFVWSNAPKRRLRDANARMAACRSSTPKSGHSTSLTNSSA